MNQKRIDPKHDENREIFIEVLHCDGFTGTHQNIPTVLQQSIHRDNEKARADSDSNHDANRNRHCPRYMNAKTVKATDRNHRLVEIGRARYERSHDDTHPQNLERIFQTDQLRSKNGTDGDTDADNGLKDGTFG